jgi:hypothetical protein
VVNSKASGPSVWVSFLQIAGMTLFGPTKTAAAYAESLSDVKKACAESNQDHVPGLYVAQTTGPPTDHGFNTPMHAWRIIPCFSTTERARESSSFLFNR